MKNRNDRVKVIRPNNANTANGGYTYMSREAANSSTARAMGLRIEEDEFVPVPDLSGDADAQPTKVVARKKRGPNKAKKEPTPAEHAH